MEEDRPASQILRELMRTYIQKRAQKLEYEDFLRQKIEAGRDSMRLKEGRSNDEVEAKFSERRRRSIMNVIWTPQAEQDRDDIWEYIASENPVTAVRIDGLFSEAAETLLTHLMVCNRVL